jgi:hypothetical protein
MSYRDRVAEYITLDNALAYNSTIDKWLWVVDNILDPADITTTEGRVNWIEDQFDVLIEEFLKAEKKA